MDETTDDRLTAALAHDVDAAFEPLVRAHQDRIYTIALRFLGDPRDAEEAAQDAFVRAYRALVTYDRERIEGLRLRPWLATIVLNVCRSRAARATRRAGASPALSLDRAADAGAAIPEPADDPAAGPTQIAGRREAARAWAARIAALPAAYRSAVVLRHVDGLSYPEVAEALGRPEGTVKAQVHRGLAMLRADYTAELRREREEMTA